MMKFSTIAILLPARCPIFAEAGRLAERTLTTIVSRKSLKTRTPIISVIEGYRFISSLSLTEKKK